MRLEKVWLLIFGGLLFENLPTQDPSSQPEEDSAKQVRPIKPSLKLSGVIHKLFAANP